jgi:hypothetical protein
LDAKSADATGAHPDRGIAGLDVGTHGCLIRRGYGIRDDAQRGEVEAGRIGDGTGKIGNTTESTRWHPHVCAKAAVDVVAGKHLRRADLTAAGAAGGTFPARHHGRNNDVGAEPGFRARPGGHDASADFMAECEREGMPGWDAVVEEAEVGVAHPAGRSFDEYLAWPRSFIPGLEDHGLAWLFNDP